MKHNKTLLAPALAALALAAMLPLQAQAHRAWLLPSSTQLEGKEPWVTVDAARSESLFELEVRPPELDGLVVTGPDGAEVKPENLLEGKLRNSFDLKLAKPGTYKISLAGTNAMASYKLNGENKRWRGPEADLEKALPAGAEDVRVMRVHSRLVTFVSAGKPNDVAYKPSDVGIEMVPLTPATELFVGETSRMRFLINGKPAAKLDFSIIPGGVRYRGVLNEMRLTTDDKGEAEVTWPSAGMFWVTASYPPRAEGGPPAPMPERRLSYGATLEVLPQ